MIHQNLLIKRRGNQLHINLPIELPRYRHLLIGVKLVIKPDVSSGKSFFSEAERGDDDGVGEALVPLLQVEVVLEVGRYQVADGPALRRDEVEDLGDVRGDGDGGDDDVRAGCEAQEGAAGADFEAVEGCEGDAEDGGRGIWTGDDEGVL